MSREFTSRLLASLLVIQLILHSSTSSQLCAPGNHLHVNGVNIIESARGYLLLVVYMPLQCSHCHRQLRELSLLAESITDLKITVVTPSYEAVSLVERLKAEFPVLAIDRDVDNVFSTLGQRSHDITLFDRCGRVSSILPHNAGQVTSYRVILEVVEEALQHAKCGWCQYDTRGSRDLSRRENEIKAKAKSLTAYMRAQERQQQYQQNYRYSQQPQQHQHQQIPQYSQTRPLTSNYQSPGMSQQQQQTYNYQPVDRRYQQQYQQGQQSQQQQQNQYHQQQQYRQQQPQPPPQQQQQQQYRQTQSNVQPDYSNLHPTVPQPIAPTKSPYGPDEDYDDFQTLLPVTTPKVQTQIPVPTQSWFPTVPTLANMAPGQRLLQVNQPFGPVVSENNIPCSAYTDDICFQQQEKLGRHGVSKCCSKGIYLTDLCVPGKCTNSTMQICCFQKFLQSKYGCCEDSTQSDADTSTNKFNRCCHDKFMQEDNCCTAEVASQYWPSVHELCYPNTNVDYSSVKMEVRFTEGLRVIDLSENKMWDYECRYGGNRVQYAYLP